MVESIVLNLIRKSSVRTDGMRMVTVRWPAGDWKTSRSPTLFVGALSSSLLIVTLRPIETIVSLPYLTTTAWLHDFPDQWPPAGQ
jgi:hypothetical protein